MTDVILTGEALVKHYGNVQALNGVDFQLERGKTLSVVGESGCGKSTLARLVTMIESPTSGLLRYDDKVINLADKALYRSLRPKVQIVFQNPYGSLNPRQKIGDALDEPLMLNTDLARPDRQAKVAEIMAAVGLRPEQAERYPHMFSGGQRQRIAIARAMMTDPDVIVLDEPVSALDVSVQAQILNLLSDLQQARELTYMFISHDLSVVRHVSDRVMVMYLGRTVEEGAAADMFADPRHPYTRALLSATPVPIPGREKQRIVLEGELPSPIDPPSGCTLHPRCPFAEAMCSEVLPTLKPVGKLQTACHVATRTDPEAAA